MPGATPVFRPRPLPPRLPTPLEPDPTLRDRFRAEVRRHPGRLAVACLSTVAGPLLVLSSAGASSPAAVLTGPAAAERIAVAPPALPPVARLAPDVGPWLATARDAAASCPGLPPEVLVAIAHVETRFGSGPMHSPAGAQGPMQFLPSTWETYGIDGNGDGRIDITDRVDAMHGAARLLCANGGGDPRRLRTAVWNYNRSAFYVDEVLRLAGVAD